MDPRLLSRRALLKNGLAIVSGAGVAALACSKKPSVFTCTDVGGLSQTDGTARSNARYVDHAADAARACKQCVQFLGSYDGCGACKLMRGPVHPDGSCNVFAPKG
jgi:hypothetical protein